MNPSPPASYVPDDDHTKWPISSATISNNKIEQHAASNRPSGHVLFTKGNPTPELTTYGIKLGWIQGVLIPCLLNIWGVMLFLRIAWIVAQAGMGFTIIIISIASIVCVITTLSLSAICTNGVVQGGGVYYLVSRSLGAELGASVGIIFAFANAVAASMNTIGFCESLNELLKSHGYKILDNGIDDTRIVGAIALFVMCVICAIGMDWESKAQNFLIIIIVVAIINYIIGACMGPSSYTEMAFGFSGINKNTIQQNWPPDFRYSENQNHNLLTVFAIYFPAVTGVQAGANICGDLKNPATAIPKGTLTALVISVTSYVVMAMLAGASAERDASGKVADLINGTLDACKPNCDYGLHNSYEIMHLIALWSPLIYGGCWAATLSTALTNLLSVPRLIQALGVDRIYPGLIFFSKPYGRHGEPYRGYVLTFSVSLLFLLIADLNTIAPLITNFYLASYALINFCTFHAGFTKAISWRPTFRYYNTWLSLFGFAICLVIMVLMSWLMALVTVLIFFTLYLLVVYRKPDARWGSSTDAYKYREAVSALVGMSARAGHVKEYSPRPLVLCGAPPARRALLDLAAMLTADGSFAIAADVIADILSNEDSLKHRHKMEEWLTYHKYRAFYLCIEGMDLENGARTMMQCAGLGRFSPNIVLLGFKTDWGECSNQDLISYVEIIRLAFERQFAVCIFRITRQLRNFSAEGPSQAVSRDAAEARAVFAVMHTSSDFQLDETEHNDSQEKILKITMPKHEIVLDKHHHVSPKRHKSYLKMAFHVAQTSNVDTWWLYDDGGLNILLPYILTNRAMKEKLPLRIFALPKQNCQLEDSQKSIETLLAMYRIDYSQLKLVTGLYDAPDDDSWALFDKIVEHFKSNEQVGECVVTEEELIKQHAKTSRYLRLREVVLENSSEAGMIVMSLPIPRRNAVSPPLYMAWLEVLSRDLPPMLFVRGNNTPVLGV